MDTDKVIYISKKGLIPYEVVDTVYNYRPSRVLFSENQNAAESGIALDDKDELLFDYNERFMEIIRTLLPKKILLLGGGALTLPKAINYEFPEVSLDVVELDPELIKISKKYFDYVPNKNTNIYIQDATDFINSTNQTYDLIIVDLFIDNLIPEPFKTKKFTRSLKGLLNKKGLVAMNIIATYYGRLSVSLAELMSVFYLPFSNVQLFPANNQLSLWISQNFIIIAQNSARDLQPTLRFKQLLPPKLRWDKWLIT